MAGLWKKFNPANDLYDQPLAYRGTIAPFGTYTNPDGSESAGFAWPGMITEPLNALQRLHENSYTEDGRLGMPNPQYQGNKDDALTSLLSIYGGNALNHATRLPENAIGMFAGRHAKTADTKAVKAWHSTPAKFDTFDNAYTDEVGFHFGSKNQAHNRAYAMSDGNPWTYFTKWRDIPVEIEINNPVALSTDPGSFMPMTLAKQLVKDGLAPHELIMEVQKVQLGPAGSPATAKAVVRDYLLSKGYDAVKYPNRFEGVGDPSYMMLNTGNVKHARTGETLYSDTGKPSIAGSAIAAEMMKRDGLSTVRPDWKAASEEDFLRVMDDGFAWDSQRQAYEDRAYADLNRLAYDRSAGEVEARNVQVRADMTPEQRRATPPWLTQDVPFEKQFVQQYGQRSPLPPQPQAPPQGGIRAAWMEPVYPEILPPAPVASTAEDALRWMRESGPIIDGQHALQQKEPLRGYRGASNPGNIARDDASVFWGTSSPDVASTYARGFWDNDVPGSVAPAEFNFSNPMTLDANGRSWANLPFDGASNADELAIMAREQGHDGLIIQNVMDAKSKHHGESALPPANTYVALQRGTVRSPLTGETLFSGGSPYASPLGMGMQNDEDLNDLLSQYGIY